MVNIALADDHVLLRSGLVALLEKLGYNVVLEANNGKELISSIEKGVNPEIILLDINMPQMDGYETALWINKNRPEIKILVLSMYDDETAIIRMLRNGAVGYILKDADPPELRQAIDAVITKGFHYSELVTGKLVHSIQQADNSRNKFFNLNDREIEFLKLASTELTYKEIAEKMNLSPRTIDGYRDALFEKLNIKNRIGLVLFALKHNIIYLD
jgi:DNA-binding NarL/FixJ family response regulator